MLLIYINFLSVLVWAIHQRHQLLSDAAPLSSKMAGHPLSTWSLLWRAGMLFAVEGTMQTAQGANYGDGFQTTGAVAGKPKNDPSPFFNVRHPNHHRPSKHKIET